MYVVTTVRYDDHRNVGYYLIEELASRAIELNSCDIFEDGYYHYAVVVYVAPGLYPNVEEIQWYHYNRQTQEVEKCRHRPLDVPDQLYIIG